MWSVLPLLLLGACSGENDKSVFVAPESPQALTLELEPTGPDPASADGFAIALDRHPQVLEAAKGHRVRQLRFEVLPAPETATAPEGWSPLGSGFIAVYFDYDTNTAFSVTGDMDNPAPYAVAASPEKLPPTLDEFEAAKLLVLADPQIQADYAAGRVEIFHAMPGTIDRDDGHRVVSVGMRPAGDTDRGEVLGVDLSAEAVLHLPGGGPPNTKVGGFVCNPPPFAGQAGPAHGTQGWARLRIMQGAQELWSLTIRRPSSSGAPNGSGVELYDVRYQGKRMINRAHLPILNVHYDGDVCGPYRDWQWQENPFLIGNTLRNVANGIVVTDWAKTMRETRDDSGNFSGVAVYWDNIHDQGVIISELEAGWYRYMPEFRLGRDGSLTMRWGFDAVQNWCTCQQHFHHSYWRVDWAIGAGDNRIEQTDDAANGVWTPVASEEKMFRDDAAGRRWRVRDVATGDSVLINPTPGEDAADAYGSGDVWVLANHGNELDDSATGPAPLPTMANLDAFLTSENVLDTDLVMWWSGHFLHNDANPLTNQTHTVQLNLMPEVW